MIQPLQQMLQDVNNNGDWQPILDYCTLIIGATDDNDIVLCYTFALMQQALSIHVDDVEKTANECLLLLNKLQQSNEDIVHWKKMLKQYIRDARKLHLGIKSLLIKPLAELSTKEKIKVVDYLHEKGGIENFRLAATIHHELMTLHKGDFDESYHYGYFVFCLYKSNQVDKADKVFSAFLAWSKENIWQHNSFVMGYSFQEKLLRYRNDANILLQTWRNAMQHEAINKPVVFPYADDVRDQLLIAANTLNLTEIKTYLCKLILKERKPSMMSQEIKNILNSQP